MRCTMPFLIAILPSLAMAEPPPPGALSCTGCHGLFEGAPNALQGMPADEIAEQFAEFRDGERDGTVMPRLVPAFTDEEARQIAEWFAVQETGQ